MKREVTLKNILGLTQEEMAMVLKINASQWSMHKSRQRDLPLFALQELGSILTYLKNSKERSEESQNFLTLEQKKAQEKLKIARLNMEHKRQFLERKIFAIENRRAECFAALEVVRFLETREANDIDIDLSECVKVRAINTLKNNPLHKLQDLQIKKEQLDMLKISLEEKMQQY